MKKFFITVISLSIFAIVAYGIAYFVRPARTVELEEYSHEAMIHCGDVYIVRDETVYYATAPGTVYNSVAEGDRVSANTVISKIFNSVVDADHLKKLRTIDEKIARLQRENSGSELYKIDGSSTENEISQNMNEVLSHAQNNNVQEIHEIHNNINNLREGKDTSITDEIAALELEHISAESEIRGTRTEIMADRSGIFSSYADGLESVLSPERAQTYTPSYIRSLQPQGVRDYNRADVSIGDPVCKIMNNHTWYVLGIISKDQKSLFDEYERVNIRFPGVSHSKISGNLIYLSEPDENDELVFLLEIPSYMEIAFSYRKLDADIVFKEYSGYKIPTEAIRTDSSLNSYYVYGMKGSESFRCNCDVLYTDTASGYSIIQSTDTAKNKLSSMERLIVGERR